MVHPIIDAYTNRGPAHSRSAAFVQTKGLVANEKLSIIPRTASPIPSSTAPAEAIGPSKKVHAPTIPINAFRPRHAEYNGSSSVGRPRIPYSSSGAQPDSQPASTPASASASAAASSSTTQPHARQQSAATPAQGNIKKKRMSLNGLDQAHHGGGNYGDNDPMTPITPAEPPRNNFGDPNKIRQFFPELSTVTT